MSADPTTATPMHSPDLPTLHLTAVDGASATIALDGGHVMSWTPADGGGDRLFVSARSTYGPGRAIRGGIPVIFPQFGPFGSLPQHGFARRCRFTMVEPPSANPGHALLRLVDTHATRAQWPHAFVLDLSVEVRGASLAVAMTVRNTDASPLSFTAAFHPYFAVLNAFATRVEGLTGCCYRDSLRDGQLFEESAAELHISGPLDRIYYQAPDRLILREGARSLLIEKSGFPDAVVWNPGLEGTRSRPDFAEGEEHRMLCVEAAAIEQPIVLAPGASWTGMQRMTTG